MAQNVWEARFSILILSALQPAAFGEHFYRITPYLMIGSVILSQFLLLRECIAGQAKENRWLILPIGIPMAILQVLYCPYPEESFYWYNGSVNYTFVYSLSLVLLTLYLEIALRETGKAKRVRAYRAGQPAGDSGGWQQFFHQRIHHVPVDLSADLIPDLP